MLENIFGSYAPIFSDIYERDPHFVHIDDSELGAISPAIVQQTSMLVALIPLMWALLVLISKFVHGQVDPTAVAAAVPEYNEPSYFLSVMVMERNQSAYLQEFVRHYLEEGVDHFFIYNSYNIPHVHSELACIDAKYYTVIPRLGNGTTATPMRQNVFNMVQPRTKWLAMVDSDDYISSRSHPGKTLREILETGLHTACDLISIPTINYAWGETNDTPVGNIRSTLTHRWGYDRKYAESHSNKAGKKGSSKFADTYEKVRNRVIFQALKVRTVGTNSATLLKRGNMCVASAQETQSCTRMFAVADNNTDTTVAPAVASDTTAIVTGGSPPPPVNALPKYCPERNIYRSKRSTSFQYMTEADIPALTLACHHYRIPSWQEWHRRARLQPHLYRDSDIEQANRQDVRDEFMLDRGLHRKYHVLQKTADGAMSGCVRAPNGVSTTVSTTLSAKVDPYLAAKISSTPVSSTSRSGSGGITGSGNAVSASAGGSGSVNKAAVATDDAAGELGAKAEPFLTTVWNFIRKWLVV